MVYCPQFVFGGIVCFYFKSLSFYCPKGVLNRNLNPKSLGIERYIYKITKTKIRNIRIDASIRYSYIYVSVFLVVFFFSRFLFLSCSIHFTTNGKNSKISSRKNENDSDTIFLIFIRNPNPTG